MVPVNTLEEYDYPEYQITESQFQLLERGYSIDQVKDMSEEEVERNLMLRNSGYVESTFTEVPNSRVYFNKKESI